ncbi:MAG: DUF2225 domain-containing protein, partial [Planctomycetes bacterium]|nr:DUF2225 domain-containing protein [Planctomycetota bacterium]
MAGGMKAGLRVPVLAPAVALLAFFLLPGTPQALDIGALPLRPGEVHPQPRQRPLTEIAALPEHEVVCPACATVVSVPEVDKLMRAPADGGERPPWRLHAASRDADLCPYPGSTMLSYQADIIVCPACGFAAGEESYATRPSVEAQAWINATFRDSLRQTQRLLLGERGADLPEEEVIAFFNHQARIPDVVRTEHFRVLSLAKKDPYLLRAEATWRSAWALRREVVAPPRGDFLARQTGSVRERLDKTGRSQDGVAGEAEALRYLLGKTRSGRDRLAPGEQLAARLMLAGLLVRLGENLEAEEELAALQRFCHERFVRPEDDPLWPTTAGRSRDRRRRELEDIRSETERELDSRFAMVRQQTEY